MPCGVDCYHAASMTKYDIRTYFNGLRDEVIVTFNPPLPRAFVADLGQCMIAPEGHPPDADTYRWPAQSTRVVNRDPTGEMPDCVLVATVTDEIDISHLAENMGAVAAKLIVSLLPEATCTVHPSEDLVPLLAASIEYRG